MYRGRDHVIPLFTYLRHKDHVALILPYFKHDKFVVSKAAATVIVIVVVVVVVGHFWSLFRITSP